MLKYFYKLDNDIYYIIENFAFLIIGDDKSSITDNKDFRGITYNFPEGKFDIHINLQCNWARININYKNGEFKDLPLNTGTIKLIPQCIKVISL